ncbi:MULTISPECIES: hypothetical protein [Lactococcus]|jgi:uncharacterized integral membrane protein|uniref:DUF1049 domain-containing protein n=1 Tax=Lactococcus garvieae TaxID=1363 RepID=A0A1I4EKK8_9LACT|nr:hypothetical protein [Lactococcus garvieae]KAA8713676.1 hypothetical protein F4V47_04850 [Lactococcus garvieae subsp. garvieae]MDG6190527.1 hypothetical protein [Lactococcus garvieae]MDH7959192.1 hypothetical protein [Lactococcus garvieae]MDT2741387.1 hypothetical protein [Lactococcus garvieae]NHI69193.1 hypothetical protein [Lactococcus garvieae]
MEKVKSFFTAKRILVLLILLLIVIFAVLNFSPVRVNMLFFNIDIPMFYGIIAVGLIGFVCGYVIRGRK